MSKQSNIVADVIDLVAECGIPIGLIPGGSVGEGTERPDSDVDFFAVADTARQPALPGFEAVAEKNGSKLLERKGRGFPIHVACWTTASLDGLLRAKPYMTYPPLRGRVVFDPTQIAEQYRVRIRRYSAAHPSIGKTWMRQLHDLHRGKMWHPAESAFPRWSDFICHIEEVFAKEIAGPDAAGDPLEAPPKR